MPRETIISHPGRQGPAKAGKQEPSPPHTAPFPPGWGGGQPGAENKSCVKGKADFTGGRRWRGGPAWPPAGPSTAKAESGNSLLFPNVLTVPSLPPASHTHANNPRVKSELGALYHRARSNFVVRSSPEKHPSPSQIHLHRLSSCLVALLCVPKPASIPVSLCSISPFPSTYSLLFLSY